MKYEAWSNARLDSLLKEKGDTLERMGDVITNREKVPIKCRKCGHEWSSAPQTLERSGCPQCYLKGKTGSRRKSKYSVEEVIDILQQNGFKIDTGSTYVNNKEPMALIDIETGERFNLSLRSFLGRKGVKNPYKGKHPNEVEEMLKKD